MSWAKLFLVFLHAGLELEVDNTDTWLAPDISKLHHLTQERSSAELARADSTLELHVKVSLSDLFLSSLSKQLRPCPRVCTTSRVAWPRPWQDAKSPTLHATCPLSARIDHRTIKLPSSIRTGLSAHNAIAKYYVRRLLFSCNTPGRFEPCPSFGAQATVPVEARAAVS